MSPSDGSWLDMYVLTPERSVDLATRFLAEFVPDRREMASEYEVPQYSESPSVVFMTDGEILEHCSNRMDEPYAVYWFNNREAEPQQGIVFYTDDGRMGLGLSVEDDSQAESFFSRLKAFAETDTAYVTCENPPPRNSVEFLKEMRTSQQQVGQVSSESALSDEPST